MQTFSNVYHRSVSGAKRWQLLNIFSLSVKYQAVDMSLAVSCDMLPLVFQLCGTPGLTAQTNNSLFDDDSHINLDLVLKMASMNLLQILSVTARFGFLFSVMSGNSCSEIAQSLNFF